MTQTPTSWRPPAWLPNALTALRIALVPAFLVHARLSVLSAERGAEMSWHRVMAVGALLGIGASDIADGWIARRFGYVTRLGATLDAFADKLAQVSLLIFFLTAGAPAFEPVPLWYVALVLGRDIVLAIGSLLVRWRTGAVEVVHHHHGRASTLVLFAILLWITAGFPREPLPVAFALSALVVVASTVAYVADGFRQVARHSRAAALAAGSENGAS